jgi:hypothetical protein
MDGIRKIPIKCYDVSLWMSNAAPPKGGAEAMKRRLRDFNQAMLTLRDEPVKYKVDSDRQSFLTRISNVSSGNDKLSCYRRLSSFSLIKKRGQEIELTQTQSTLGGAADVMGRACPYSMFPQVCRPLSRAKGHKLAAHKKKGASEDQAVLDHSIWKELLFAAILIWVRDWCLQMQFRHCLRCCQRRVSKI